MRKVRLAKEGTPCWRRLAGTELPLPSWLESAGTLQKCSKWHSTGTGLSVLLKSSQRTSLLHTMFKGNWKNPTRKKWSQLKKWLLNIILLQFVFLFQMILTVYLSDGEQALTEVPITPETSCRDVVEFCKEPGESGCHLAEVWRGNGRGRMTLVQRSRWKQVYSIWHNEGKNAA